jgi:hypothetical protein
MREDLEDYEERHEEAELKTSDENLEDSKDRTIAF